MKFEPLFRTTINNWLTIIVIALLSLVMWRVLDPGTVPMEGISIVVSEDSDAEAGMTDTLHINYANATQLSAFGFKSALIVNILKYRDAGGWIRDKEHLLRMRGIDSALVERKSELLIYDVPVKGGKYADYSLPKEKTKRKAMKVSLYYTSADTLMKLGISQPIIDSLLEYREKYIVRGSMAVDTLRAVTPDIFSYVMAPHISERIVWRRDTLSKSKEKEVILVDINAADMEQLCKVRGIGEKTAKRIIEKRTVLGGFIDIEQIKEIATIDTARYNQIAPQLTIGKSSIKHIKINEVTQEELLAHPYMRKELGRALLRLRYRHKKLTREMAEPLFTDSKKDKYMLEYIQF